MKKNIISVLIMCFCLCAILPLFSGCQTNYPDSALFVGGGEKYETIQAAIDASEASGQYIVVKSGKYKENLFISKTIKIVGYSNSVTLNGSATIAADGVYFEKIAFSGNGADAKSGIIISSEKDVTGLNIFHCSFKGYEEYGLVSEASESSPNKFNALTIQETSFVGNKISGIKMNNIKSFVLESCAFEKNGSEASVDFVGSAVSLDLIAGKYSSVEVHSTDFKQNGNKNTRGAAFSCSHKNNSFDGEIVFDDCLFQGNSNDVISGLVDTPNSSIDICVINQRGLSTHVQKLDQEDQ